MLGVDGYAAMVEFVEIDQSCIPASVRLSVLFTATFSENSHIFSSVQISVHMLCVWIVFLNAVISTFDLLTRNTRDVILVKTLRRK